ncbi:hypothetical protein D3C76_1017430 [compost metagenome]
MPKHMRRDPDLRKGLGRSLPGLRKVTDALVDTEAGHRRSAHPNEHRLGGPQGGGAFVQHGLQGLRCLAPQGAGPPLQAFAQQSNLGGRLQIELADRQLGYFGDPCPRVVQQHQERAIAYRKPVLSGNAGEQGFDFIACQELHLRQRAALHRNGRDLCAGR